MANSMQHWNACQAVIFKIDYTGADPMYFEPARIGFLAVDSNFIPRKDVMPLSVNLKVECPDRFDADTANMNKKEFVASQTHMPMPTSKFLDVFNSWFEKLDVKFTKYGTQKRLILINHNMLIELDYLRQIFLGDVVLYFDLLQVRDTATVAQFLNDYADIHNEKILYAKTDREYLRLCLQVEKPGRDIISDMVVTAQVYQRLTRKGIY